MKLSDFETLRSHGVIVAGDTSFRGTCPKETLEQTTFFSRIRREFPETYGRLAVHVRNEQQMRGGQFSTVTKARAEGMTPGAPDIIIPGRRTFVCELKRRDYTKSDWQEGQMEYLIAADRAGAWAVLALGCDAAWQAFLEWES